MEYDEAYNYFMSGLPIVQKSIIPMFGNVESNKRPKFIGSSIYCKHENSHFLISAAHVFQAVHPKKLWYPFEQGLMVEIPSKVYLYPNQKEKDFCIAPLYESLKSWIPLDTTRFGIFNENEQYQHILYGYPGSKVKEEDENVKLTLMGYLTSAATRESKERANIDEEYQFGVQFWKKNVFSEKQKKVTFPDPQGMSGGAVFQFNEKYPNEQKLVGVMTEWKAQSAKIIVATKIDAVMKNVRILNI